MRERSYLCRTRDTYAEEDCCDNDRGAKTYAWVACDKLNLVCYSGHHCLHYYHLCTTPTTWQVITTCHHNMTRHCSMTSLRQNMTSLWQLLSLKVQTNRFYCQIRVHCINYRCVLTSSSSQYVLMNPNSQNIIWPLSVYLYISEELLIIPNTCQQSLLSRSGIHGIIN